MTQQLKKWIDWLSVIHDEIQQLLIARDTFWTVQEIIKLNTAIQKPNVFYGYLGDSYISHMLIGIRRQIKTDKDKTSISLAQLLDEIHNSPTVLSREYFVGLYKGSTVEENANHDFDTIFQANKENYISPRMVKADFDKLKSVAKKCEDFADKRVAHRDKRKPIQPLTFREVDDVVDLLDKLYVKYHLIFHASHMDSLMPIHQDDWESIFDQPWRLPNQ